MLYFGMIPLLVIWLDLRPNFKLIQNIDLFKRKYTDYLISTQNNEWLWYYIHYTQIVIFRFEYVCIFWNCICCIRLLLFLMATGKISLLLLTVLPSWNKVITYLFIYLLTYLLTYLFTRIVSSFVHMSVRISGVVSLSTIVWVEYGVVLFALHFSVRHNYIPFSTIVDRVVVSGFGQRRYAHLMRMFTRDLQTTVFFTTECSKVA